MASVPVVLPMILPGLVNEDFVWIPMPIGQELMCLLDVFYAPLDTSSIRHEFHIMPALFSR